MGWQLLPRDSIALLVGFTQVLRREVDSISLLIGLAWDDVRRDLACFADKEKQLMLMMGWSLGSMILTLIWSLCFVHKLRPEPIFTVCLYLLCIRLLVSGTHVWTGCTYVGGKAVACLLCGWSWLRTVLSMPCNQGINLQPSASLCLQSQLCELVLKDIMHVGLTIHSNCTL